MYAGKEKETTEITEYHESNKPQNKCDIHQSANHVH